MAGSFNRVILVGNLTKDPEIRYVGSGAAVTKFRLAVNPNKKDAKPEDTLYIDIVAWDKLAETCNTFLKKGSPVLCEGRLSIRSYDDTKTKDEHGQAIRRTATEVVINTMQMLSSRADGEGGGYSSGGGGGANYAPSSAPSGGGGAKFDDNLDDEIPF